MAGVGISGDMRGLSRMIEQVSKLASADTLLGLSRELGEEARTQTLLGFEQSRDPYGKAWKPVHRGGQPLRDTGRLFNSWSVSASAGRFRLSSNVRYASTHQTGARIKATGPGPLKFRVGPEKVWRSKREVTIPQRQMLPDSRGLGPIWHPAMQKAAESYIKRKLGMR